jgi:predicted esterase
VGKVVDGDPSDWVGDAAGLSGTTVQSAGELVHQDFLFDDHGADDGLDLALAGLTEPLVDVVPELDRPLRQGPVLAGILTNGVVPGSRPMQIGDATTPEGRAQAADLDEVRVAPAAGGVAVLVRTSQLQRAGDLAVLLLVDLDGAASAARRAIPFGSGLTTSRAELAVLLTAAGARTADLVHGGPPAAGGPVAVDATTNSVEALVPMPGGADPRAVAVAAGYADGPGTGLLDVGPGSAPNVVDVAFEHEPVSVSMDEAQALLLAGGTIDAAFAPVDLGALRAGATQRAVPGPGYYEARFTSTTPGVADESLPRQGAAQAYGLYLPTGWTPGSPAPTTLWLHYGGGDTHHLGAFQPGMVAALGEARGNVLVSPSGRGTYSFFGGAGYADVFEALADSDRFGRDPDRTTIAGYSMGSYGTMLLTALHPDLWAGALAVDGTPPSRFDGWTQNRANAAPVPFVLMGLLAYPDMHPDYEALRDAGASARIYLYPTDHYTNIAIDRWRQLTEALGTPVRDRAPEHVRYTRVPAIERTVGEGLLAPGPRIRENPAVVPVVADGAWWVGGIEVRDGDPASPSTMATVDATTDGHGHVPTAGVPEAGASIEGAATPYLYEGVRNVVTGRTVPRADTFRATLTNVASVRFDLEGMGLCTGDPVTGTITTDGPATVHLDRTAVQLAAAGTHTVAATCSTGLASPASARPAAPAAPADAGRDALPHTGGGLPPTPLLLAALGVLVARAAADRPRT